MATIHHNQYFSNISFQNFVRAIKDFLVTFEPKPGLMWSMVYSSDPDPSEFSADPIVFILKKECTSVADEAPLYVKLVYASGVLSVLASPSYNALDNTDTLRLTGSQKNVLESDSATIAVYRADGTIATPDLAPVCRLIADPGFDPLTEKFSKAWLIRQLGPLFDQTGERKNTNISFWASVCTDEVGVDPITTRGYYQHIGFGVSGEALVPDATYSHGPGIYTMCGSYALAAPTNISTDERIWAGGGNYDNTQTTGSIVLVGAWEGKQTWFCPASMYGYIRDPFDEARMHNAGNVGFDFTELCKYSPYSGVRVLTPAYVFGQWDNLYRILSRLPVFYTDMAGLYAGDTISQVLETEVNNYMIFPFIVYGCVADVEAKRGYAIFVPNTDEV